MPAGQKGVDVFMSDILDEIIANKRIEVEQFKKELPFRDLAAKVEKVMDEGAEVPSMRGALMASDSGIISEFKRKSPSKGWIKEEGRADVIPLSYQQNGASALSILTDTKYFGGCDDFIRILMSISFIRLAFAGHQPCCSLQPT